MVSPVYSFNSYARPMPFKPLSPIPPSSPSGATDSPSGLTDRANSSANPSASSSGNYSPSYSVDLPNFNPQPQRSSASSRSSSDSWEPAPRPNPFAPNPSEPHLPLLNPLLNIAPQPPRSVSASPPLRKRQNPVHSTPKSPDRKRSSRRKSNPSNPRLSTHSTSVPFPSMATSSRSLRTPRPRSSRSDRKNRFQVVSNSPESGQSLGSEKAGREPGKSRGRSKRLPLPVLYGIRLLILGVGLGVIAGTLLAAIDPDYQVAAEPSDPNASGSSLVEGNKKILPVAAKNALVLKSEMTDLSQQLQALANKQPDLVAGAFVVDLDTGNYSKVNVERSFATASMVKVPILVAFFQEVDAGNIELTEQLTMRQDLVAPHAGDMQYLPVGTQFSALETAEEMIRISDNTATNMLIDRLGGIAAVNQRFKQWGLSQTTLNEWLPDLEGTNISSPHDLVALMSMVEQGQLVSLRSRDRLLAILRTPVTQTLLPQGLGEGATIAHKTGDIGTLVGDVGLIDMPSGKRYLAAMMVERPFNDDRAQELIRQMSRASYDYLEKLPVQDSQQKPQQNIETPAGILTQQGQVVSPASLPVTTRP